MCFQIALCLKAVWAKFNYAPSIDFPLLPSPVDPNVICGVFLCYAGTQGEVEPLYADMQCVFHKVSGKGDMMEKLPGVTILPVLCFPSPPLKYWRQSEMCCLSGHPTWTHLFLSVIFHLSN